MEMSNPVAPAAKALAKTKSISLRFRPNNEYHQATLEALNGVRVDPPSYSGYTREIPNKAMYILGMVLGARPYTFEAFESVLDVMKTQRERFSIDADKKPSPEPVPVEKPLVNNGLRLVK